MVAVCILLHAEFGSNHHREDAPHFIKPSIDWRMKAADFEHILKVNLDDKLAKVSWSHFLRFFTANKSFVVTEMLFLQKYSRNVAPYMVIVGAIDS